MIHLLARWSLSRHLDDGGAPGPRLRRHLDGCPACRAYAERLQALDAALTRQAPRAPSPALVAPSPRPRLALAGCAAAVMAVAAYFVVATAMPDRAEPGGAVAIAESERRPDAAFALTTSLAQKLGEVPVAEPLEAELAALQSDGRRGLQAILAISGLE